MRQPAHGDLIARRVYADSVVARTLAAGGGGGRAAEEALVAVGWRYRSPVTIIAGYDDGPGLGYDGAELLASPGFWPAHLGAHLMETMDEAAALFGDELADVQKTYARLTDRAAWPVFWFGTGRGARLAVVYRNFDEDEGVDYLLVPDGQDAVTLAVDEGGQFGRGITWNELAALAGRQPGERDRAAVLLLLAPMLTRVEVSDEEAAGHLAGALRTVGVRGDAELIAARILHPDGDEDDYDEEPPAADSLLDRLLRP